MHRKLLTIPGFLGVMTLVIVAGAYAGSVLAQPQSASLQCPEGDLVLNMAATLGEDPPGGPGVPEEALGVFLQQDYPKLQPTDFRRIPDDPPAAVFIYESAGAPQAFAGVEKHGDSWYVTKFSACNSVAAQASEGSQP